MGTSDRVRLAPTPVTQTLVASQATKRAFPAFPHVSLCCGGPATLHPVIRRYSRLVPHRSVTARRTQPAGLHVQRHLSNVASRSKRNYQRLHALLVSQLRLGLELGLGLTS